MTTPTDQSLAFLLEEGETMDDDSTTVDAAADDALTDTEATPLDDEADTGTMAQADAATKPESSETADAAAEDEPEEPEPETYVVNKSGKGKIPYSVLEQERKTRQQLARQLADANRRLEELQKARAIASTDGNQDDELAELEEDAPVVAKQIKALKEEVERLKTSVPEPVSPQATEVQELIDGRPLLAKWQARGGALWQEATALDDELRADPEWAGKSMAERFDEVQRRIAEANDIPLPSAKPQATKAQPTQAAKAAKPPTTKQVKPTLTDLGGTSTVATDRDPMEAMSPRDALSVAMKMSPAELRRLWGATY